MVPSLTLIMLLHLVLAHEHRKTDYAAPKDRLCVFIRKTHASMLILHHIVLYH